MDRDPWEWQAIQCPTQQPWLVLEGALQRVVERCGKQGEHQDTQADHDAERPEQWCDLRNRIINCFLDHFRRCSTDVRRVTLQQQTESKVIDAAFQCLLRSRIRVAVTQLLEGDYRRDTILDAFAVALLNVVQTRNLFIQ